MPWRGNVCNLLRAHNRHNMKWNSPEFSPFPSVFEHSEVELVSNEGGFPFCLQVCSPNLLDICFDSCRDIKPLLRKFFSVGCCTSFKKLSLSAWHWDNQMWCNRPLPVIESSMSAGATRNEPQSMINTVAVARVKETYTAAQFWFICKTWALTATILICQCVSKFCHAWLPPLPPI